MEWNETADRVSPYIVKIETPMGHGTGFVCFYNEKKSVVGIATALHVVSYAHEWRQPIKLEHYPSATKMFLSDPTQRAILTDPGTDSAVIIIAPGTLGLPDDSLPLLPVSTVLAVASEVGWLGFPALAPDTLCFFQGSISARYQDHSYLIDGVAINGVSGGPVFLEDQTGVQIVGTISAYFPNRATGDALPGLSVARDVTHFHNSIKYVKSVDEAAEKAAAEQVAQKRQALTPAPSAPPQRDATPQATSYPRASGTRDR
jgi:hypothetical protein